jgi:hypothetical protein
MPATTNPALTQEVTMSVLTVNIANTIGQESAIEANGSPEFSIEVTSPAVPLPDAFDGTKQEINGFGRVLRGPVKGYEILYTLDSVVG